MPPVLQILAVIALVLYILFGYLIPSPPAGVERSRYFRAAVSGLVIVLILILWFVLPVRVG